MSATSFEDKLKDLNLTTDEVQKFSDAFKNEEFRKLFMEYAEELNDPKNRELYEKEIRAVEAQQGSDVTFVHPNPGHVLKTTCNGKQKCFINIATNEHVEKPSFTKADHTAGKQGANWSLPHCLAGPHEDIDHESKTCTIYDVIFSPDTYRMAETNAKFMTMLEESALDSVEKNYHCQLDKNNVKRLKMKFKGVPKATIIRKKKENSEPASQDTEDELKHETDRIIDKAMATAAQNHKVVLSSHNRTVNSSPSAPAEKSQRTSVRTDENGFTIPGHRIVHRGEFDMQDCSNALVQQVHSMRPKELLVEIDLPLCQSTNNVDLDVCERSLKLHCDAPKYSLDLALPYPVRESDSHARFDKKQRKLLVTLAVIKEAATNVEFHEDVDMEQTTEEPEPTSPTTSHQIVPSIETPPVQTYSAIPFDYKQGLVHLALVLQVKNVDRTSLKIDNDGQHITIQLASLGSGCYPLFYQLCLDFDQPMTFQCADTATTTTFNDDNVLILLKKSTQNQALTQFFSGVSREDMKINYFPTSTTAETPSSSSSTSAMTKEDFLRQNSNSSGSSNGDQQPKLTKKQAKKMAKRNVNNNNSDQLVQNMTEITLQAASSNSPEEQSDQAEEIEQTLSQGNNDKLPDAFKKAPHPSVYRRHMSESHVDLEANSNGEFKLKGILKSSTKYRSYSESLSEPANNLNGEFLREESVFEACSTTDDLTSSNENNSIVTSPDSNGGGAGGSGSLSTTPGSAGPVKHVTFNNQVSRKTFKPGGPVSGMKKLSSNQQRKLKKRRRQDSLNSQSSDQDDQAPHKAPEKSKAKPSDDYKNPVKFQDVISWQANGGSEPQDVDDDNPSGTSKSAVRFTNPLIFELEN